MLNCSGCSPKPKRTSQQTTDSGFGNWGLIFWTKVTPPTEPLNVQLANFEFESIMKNPWKRLISPSMSMLNTLILGIEGSWRMMHNLKDGRSFDHWLRFGSRLGERWFFLAIRFDGHGDGWRKGRQWAYTLGHFDSFWFILILFDSFWFFFMNIHTLSRHSILEVILLTLTHMMWFEPTESKSNDQLFHGDAGGGLGSGWF